MIINQSKINSNIIFWKKKIKINYQILKIIVLKEINNEKYLAIKKLNMNLVYLLKEINKNLFKYDYILNKL